MYRAIMDFVDLQDNERSYRAGETFPRPGLRVTKARLAELAGNDNKMGFPLIEAVEAPVEAGKAEDKEIQAESEKPAVKPRRSRKKG